jgi:hypothetical protein
MSHESVFKSDKNRTTRTGQPEHMRHRTRLPEEQDNHDGQDSQEYENMYRAATIGQDSQNRTGLSIPQSLLIPLPLAL